MEQLKHWLQDKNIHQDDIEEILEAYQEEQLKYLRHDLYILVIQYLDETLID